MTVKCEMKMDVKQLAHILTMIIE